MFLSQFLIACALLFFGGWLHWSERRGWPGEKYDSDLDQVYLRRRARSRNRVTVMFVISGILVLVSAFVSTGKRDPDDKFPAAFFVAAWTIVTFVLMVILILAMIDVVRTQNYEKHKRKEIRQTTFKNTDSNEID